MNLTELHAKVCESSEWLEAHHFKWITKLCDWLKLRLELQVNDLKLITSSESRSSVTDWSSDWSFKWITWSSSLQVNHEALWLIEAPTGASSESLEAHHLKWITWSSSRYPALCASSVNQVWSSSRYPALCASSMCKLYVQALCASSMCKLYVQALCASSMCKLAVHRHPLSHLLFLNSSFSTPLSQLLLYPHPHHFNKCLNICTRPDHFKHLYESGPFQTCVWERR